jgi:murein DD-endopeptidase MepM/ murein hydrolase activator NlpD
MPWSVILELADIFSWEVDFDLHMQRGDAFAALVETRTRHGQPMRYGPVVAAEIQANGRTFTAVRFQASGEDDAHYYTPEGRSLETAFLRYPLKYRRISSPFRRSRRHPILGGPRPHLGVDFAAPLGTPVRAAGDGRVLHAGWAGEFGKMVKLRHGGGYCTLYGHLKGIAGGARTGNRVKRGQVIGWVGQTGLATGPHLHYGMFRRGEYVDPLKVKLPWSREVPSEATEAFAETRDRLLRQLRSESQTGPPPSSAP